jgi:CHASE2 domain-containing sensor protein
MRQPDIPKKPNLYGWLWWLALIFAAIGGLVSYLLLLNPINPELRQQLMMTATFSIISVGVCIIAATAHWWMHR